MSVVSDRIGVILKYGKYMGSLTKRYFYIDNEGTLFYTEQENAILTLLEETDFDDKKFTNIISSNKSLSIVGITFIGPIKIYINAPFEGRSYFELFIDNRSMLIFAWKDEYTASLRDYITSFNNIINYDVAESEFIRLSRGVNSDIQLMDNIIDKKLKNKFVNQNNWQMKYIKVVNPTSGEEEYEETWIQLDNGSNYSGPVRRGMPHGIGKEYRPDGVVYSGSFYEGKWHGFGTLTLVNLDTYSGEFINGCICGI
jgi:hypothetical protein